MTKLLTLSLSYANIAVRNIFRITRQKKVFTKEGEKKMGFFKKLGKAASKAGDAAESVTGSKPAPETMIGSNTTVTAVDRSNERKAAEPADPGQEMLKARKKMMSDLQWEAGKMCSDGISAIDHPIGDFLDWLEGDMDMFDAETADELIGLDELKSKLFEKIAKISETYGDNEDSVAALEKLKSLITDEISKID